MSEQKPHRIPTPKLVAIAALLGVVAGAGAVYVKGGLSGNAPPPASAGTSGPAVAQTEGCGSAKAIAAALEPYATGAVAAMSPQETPRSLSAMSFDDADGKKTSLADFAGKTLLVNIWATWCVPCRTEMPALDRLEAARGGPDFEVVAVNIDTGDASKPEKFLRQVGADHIALHRDATMGVFDHLKKEGLAFGLPVTLLVGRNGCLLAAMNGPAEWDGADAAKLLKSAVDLQAPKAVGSSDAS